MEKKELRRLIRQAKKEHTDEELQRISESICHRLLSHDKIREADTILAYWSLPDEVCTHDFVQQLWQQGKRVLLPKVISDTEMTLHEFREGGMSVGAYGIMEPTSPAVSLSTLAGRSLVGIIPGMAFSPDGYRLGRGKGYYDRCLSQIPYIYIIGICYPFQLLREIPHEAHDVNMDEVIS